MSFLLLKTLVKLAQKVIWTCAFFWVVEGCARGLQDHPKYDDLLEGITVFSVWVYSWLRFISAKGYKAKSTKGKGEWGRVRRKPGTSFPESSPGGVTGATSHLTPPASGTHQ